MDAKNEEQQKLWNGTAGQAWVDGQSLLDGMFQPFERLLVEEARRHGAGAVLDVGCGAGATTLAIARLGGVRAMGVDISAPLIASARGRAQREGLAAEFICADAQTHDFGSARFELVVSRFGVMFFEDSVQAFLNLRQACVPGAELRAVAFRSAAENPFMTAAERAATPLLPALPPRKADGPGQFAFADRVRTQAILRDSGWCDVDLRPIDVECRFPTAALDGYLARFGPVGLYLAQADEATRQRVVDAVRAAFVQYQRGDEVRFTAACWLMCARNP
jgi:SAM-dependent methyltransferase